MMTINLLPEDQRIGRDQWRRNLGLILCLWLLMAAGMAGVCFFQSRQINTLTTRSNQLRAEIKQYSRIRQSLTENEKKLKAIRQKIEVISRFNHDRTRPVTLLTEVANRVLEDAVWLTKLEARPEMLILSGYSMDERSVAALMTAMEKYDDYPDVSLKSLKKEVVDSPQPLMAFELVSRTNAAPADRPDTPKKK